MVILGMAFIIGGLVFAWFAAHQWWKARGRRNRRVNALITIPPHVRTWPDVI
jgi:hypothetical protein